MELITNQFIPNQFPKFYNSQNKGLFIAFVKAYYEWLEMEGNPLYYSRNLLKFSDIDHTTSQFIQYFKNEYLLNLPTTMVANQQLLVKHIIDLYRSKGTKRGYELLFRILFNEDISIYLPGQFVLKPSDNQWVVPQYIEVTDSPYNTQLVGLSIYCSTNDATALVEEYNTLNLNNKVINVLVISNTTGIFNYGSQILSNDLPELTTSNAPFVIGSLSSVSVKNGGALFNLGDEVDIKNSDGNKAIGRVSSITEQNGKVIFNLIDGGFGFSLNAQIQVTGGNGSGATFKIGNIVNQETFVLNIDEINTYYNTQLDNAGVGFNLVISNTHGTFSTGEVVNAYSNGIGLDFAYLSGNLSNTEILANSSLGISNLEIIEIDNPSYVNLTGPESALNNANLVGGIILKGQTSGSLIYVNSVLPKTQYLANGTVSFANSTLVTVHNPNGYFLPTSTLYGQISGANAYINQTVRNTNWGFPVFNITNLDQEIQNCLTYENLIVGTIANLIDENPGEGYSSNPNVSIIEPLIAQLQLPDGEGGFYGQDANVVAIANDTNGIITSLKIYDSGYGFSPGEMVDISTNTNPFAATGAAIVDGNGVSLGYWRSNKSFPSDQIYIQDSYYYQPFSYEIVAPRMFSTYQKFVTDLVHPIEMLMFGRYRLQDIQDDDTDLISSSFVQTS